MKRIYKVLGTIGSFFWGYYIGTVLISFISIQHFSNIREITVAFGVLLGLIAVSCWINFTPSIKKNK